MTHGVVVGFEYSREASYSYTAKLDGTSVAKEIDVGSDPATVIELPQIIGSFVIAPN